MLEPEPLPEPTQAIASKWAFINAPLIFIIAALWLHQFGDALYAKLELEESSGYFWLVRFGLLWAVGWWVINDNRQHGLKLPYDFGMFLGISLWVAVPYYLFKTRGVRAFLTMFWFTCIYVMIAVLTHLIVSALFPEKVA
jgi:hypothetical protein